MTILTVVPVYSHLDIAKQAIASMYNPYVISNNPELGIRAQIHNKENNYCNGAWNQGMKFFLEDGSFDVLCLGSSDVIMHRDWQNNIPLREKEVYVPRFADTLETMEQTDAQEKELLGGVAGAFMILPKEAVEIVYPIPKQLKHWFGDQYIFTKLRNRGWKVMECRAKAFHYQSLSNTANPDIMRIIAEDQTAWEKLCQQPGFMR